MESWRRNTMIPKLKISSLMLRIQQQQVPVIQIWIVWTIITCTMKEKKVLIFQIEKIPWIKIWMGINKLQILLIWVMKDSHLLQTRIRKCSLSQFKEWSSQSWVDNNRALRVARELSIKLSRINNNWTRLMPRIHSRVNTIQIQIWIQINSSNNLLSLRTNSYRIMNLPNVLSKEMGL